MEAFTRQRSARRVAGRWWWWQHVAGSISCCSVARVSRACTNSRFRRFESCLNGSAAVATATEDATAATATATTTTTAATATTTTATTAAAAPGSTTTASPISDTTAAATPTATTATIFSNPTGSAATATTVSCCDGSLATSAAVIGWLTVPRFSPTQATAVGLALHASTTFAGGDHSWPRAPDLPTLPRYGGVRVEFLRCSGLTRLDQASVTDAQRKRPDPIVRRVVAPELKGCTAEPLESTGAASP